MKELLEMLVNACGVDVDMTEIDNTCHIDFNDFEGFDENWDEIMRDYENPQAVSNLINWLNDNCLYCDEEYYTTYDFGDFIVKVGYTSYDI
jgi:hypothetical protein